jgi:putative chitinase
MSRFSGHGASTFDQIFCDDFNKLLHITGFDTDLTAFRMLLAQMAHETGNWIYMKECGSNSYFTDMYENRSDLGNYLPGDGAKFAGTGAIMVTGRANFADSYKYLQQMDGLNDPRFMEEGCPYVSVKYPFRVCLGWLIKNNYFELCKGGDLLTCTRRLNGGTRGLEDRQYWWDKARQVITQDDLR